MIKHWEYSIIKQKSSYAIEICKYIILLFFWKILRKFSTFKNMKNIYETFTISVMSWYREQTIIFKMLHFSHRSAHLYLFLYFAVLSSVTLQVGWRHRFVLCQFRHPIGKSRYFSLTLCLHLHSVYLLLGRFPSLLSCVHHSTVSAQWTLQPPGIYIVLLRPDMCSHYNHFYSACRTDLCSISSRPYYFSLKMAFYA